MVIKNLLIHSAYAANYTTLKELLSFNGTDPRKDLGTIKSFIESVTNAALDFAGVFAVIMILYSAVLYTTSYGEEGKAESAKKTLYWSIIGLAVIAFAKVMLNLVKTTLQ